MDKNQCDSPRWYSFVGPYFTAGGDIELNDGNETKVVITDIQIPFWSMVVLLVKLSLAAIPAMLILGGLSGLVAVAMSGFLRGVGG